LDFSKLSFDQTAADVSLDRQEIARRLILDFAPRHAKAPLFLAPCDESERSMREMGLISTASAFLTSHGVLNIDDEDESCWITSTTAADSFDNRDFAIPMQ
jgi:hypothetical protein